MAESSASSPLRTVVLPLLVLIVAALLRVPGIDNPPLDIHHVRQSDTASIARVMARDGIDPLHPRIGWAGPQAGTVESELPIYATLVALGWSILGVDEPAYWWPRLLSVACWALAALALWTWVRRRRPGPAWPAVVLLLLSPLAVVFSRNIQPDALALMLLLWGLERCDAAGDDGGAPAAVLGGLLVGLGIAAKGQLVLLLPLIPLLLLMRRAGPGSLATAIATTLALGLPAVWYWHAHVHLGADGASFGVVGPGSQKWGGPAVWFDPTTWRAIGGTLLVHAATPVGLVLAAVGASKAATDVELRPFLAGAALVGAGFVVLTQGFRLHNYYQLPLLPFLSVLAAEGARELFATATTRGRRAGLGAVLGLLALGSAALGAVFVQGASKVDERLELLGIAMALILPPDLSVLMVDQHPQSALYAIDRRGFHRSDITFSDVVEFEALGADYLVLTTTSSAMNDSALMLQLKDSRPLEAAAQPGWMLFRLGVALPAKAATAGDDDDSAGADSAGDDDSAAP